jgi:hypothetical protein
MGGAADALREVRGRLDRATAFELGAGAWRGPASEAFLAGGAALQAGLGRAADTLEQAAGALAELAARLDHAQATWDRARRLAATVGVDLEAQAPAPPPGAWAPSPGVGAWAPEGGVRSPASAVDPAAMLLGGQALAMAAAAGHEAAAARRAAAARLDQAARPVPVPAPPPGGSRPPSPAHDPGSSHPPAGTGHAGAVPRVVGRALEVGAEVATATHHLAAGAEARLEAAGRLAATADDPAVRAAAGRVVQSAGAPMLDGRIMGALPLFAPILYLTAAVSQGEPLPRALAGAVGTAVGADLGSRAGLAICGGEAAATQGAGLVVCPTLTAVGGTFGAEAGRRAALHVYDELTEPDPPAGGGPESGAVRPGPGPGG